MFTQEVLPFDVPKPPSPEQIPVCLPESLSARLPRPHRPPSNVVKRPLSARDLSRHSKVTDRELDERRRSSAPTVEPIIKRPPAKNSADYDNPHNHEAVTDDRDLEDLGRLLRLKVKNQVDEGMLANKKSQATYTAPSGGGATARPTLLQKYEVPQFVKQCRRAEEAHIRNKEVEEEARPNQNEVNRIIKGVRSVVISTNTSLMCGTDLNIELKKPLLDVDGNHTE